jgi:hypothetical protein
MLCHHRHYIDRIWSLDTMNKCSKRSLIASVRFAYFHAMTPLLSFYHLHGFSFYKALGNISRTPRPFVFRVRKLSLHYTCMVSNQKIPDILHYIYMVYNLDKHTRYLALPLWLYTYCAHCHAVFYLSPLRLAHCSR